MAVSIGTDIVEIERIKNVYARQKEKIAQRILTPMEMSRFEAINDETVKISYLAKRWCAKEAIAKALGTGIAKGIGWQQMAVLNAENGAPYVELTDAALLQLKAIGAEKALISLSDERHYCVAFCMLV